MKIRSEKFLTFMTLLNSSNNKIVELSNGSIFFIDEKDTRIYGTGLPFPFDVSPQEKIDFKTEYLDNLYFSSGKNNDIPIDEDMVWDIDMYFDGVNDFFEYISSNISDYELIELRKEYEEQREINSFLLIHGN